MEIPVVYGEVKAVHDRRGRFKYYQVEVTCPYCGREHTHGAGTDGTALGHRLAHCSKLSGYDIRLPEGG